MVFDKFRFIQTGLDQSEFDTAAKYCEEDMVEDVKTILQERYPNAQAAADGSSIKSIIVSIMSKYLDESANIYSTGVEKRELVDENGEVDEEETEKFNNHLEEIAFDFTKSAQERYIVGLNSCGIYYEEDVKLNQMVAHLYLPQDITPVLLKDDKFFVDKTKSSSYEGFAVAMHDEVLEKEGRDRYALITADTIYQYEARIGKPEEPTNLSSPPNPYKIQTFSIWHNKKPTGRLIPKAVPSIFVANRELNILWTMLIDTIRFQGGGALVKSSNDPNEIGATVLSGVRFPMVMDINETAGYINSANDYTGLVNSLVAFLKLVALCNGISPNDFNLEGSRVSSGFAKLIENLPKIENREKRVRWYQKMEGQDFPKQAAVLIKMGVLSERARDLKLKTYFKEPSLIKSIDETIKENEFNFKYGLSSPVRLLMQQESMTEDEAMEYISSNKAHNDQLMNQYSPLDIMNKDKAIRESALTNLIGAKDNDKEQGSDKSTSRRDRSGRKDEATGSLDRAEGLEGRAGKRNEKG